MPSLENWGGGLKIFEYLMVYMCRGRGVSRGRKRDEVMSDGESVVEEEEEEVMAVDDKKCSEIKWQIMCTLEEWEELVDNLSSIKTPTDYTELWR